MEQEQIVARPKDGNPNFEELYVKTSPIGHQQPDDDDEYNFAADARIAFETPGLSSYLEEGAPFTPPPGSELTKEALDHLQRQVAVMTDPFVKFLADVAVSSGSSLNNMLVNPNTPLVNTQATSVQTLVSSSAFPRDLMLVVLAKVLLELPVSLSTALKQSSLQQQQQQAQVKQSSGFNGDPNGTPSKITAQIGETVANYLSSVDPIGVNPFGGARGLAAATAAGPGVDSQQQALTDALLSIQAGSTVLDWTWSQMPEQAGMMLARPDVTSKIQSCFQEIRSLSPAHSQIKLWHLITGPLVRGRFARLVASMLNTVPTEMQYPGYVSVRGNGSVIGSRVTPGIRSQVAHSHVYNSLLKWFKHVGYRDSEEWLQVQQRVNESSTVIERAQTEVRAAERDLKVAVNDVWKQISAQVQENAADLWFHEKISKTPLQTKQPIIDRLRRNFAVLASIPGQTPFASAISGVSDIYLLTPFVGPIYPPAGLPSADARTEVISFLDARVDTVSMLKAAAVATDNIATRVASFPEIARVLALSSSIHIMTNALINLRRVVDQQLADRRLFASFDDTRKVELVHREPGPSERIPVRNFLYSGGRW